MARRRKSAFSSLAPWLVVVALLAAAFFGWRHRARWLPAPEAPEAATAAATFDVCALAPRARIAEVLGANALEARHVGAASDVPAAGACTFEFERAGHRASVVVLAFTRGSLARGGNTLGAQAYYASAVTGLEYATKEVPRTVAGLGDEAATAGFGGAGPAQLVARRGDLVLSLVLRGVERDAAERLARELLAAR